MGTVMIPNGWKATNNRETRQERKGHMDKHDHLSEKRLCNTLTGGLGCQLDGKVCKQRWMLNERSDVFLPAM